MIDAALRVKLGSMPVGQPGDLLVASLLPDLLDLGVREARSPKKDFAIAVHRCQAEKSYGSPDGEPEE